MCLFSSALAPFRLVEDDTWDKFSSNSNSVAFISSFVFLTTEKHLFISLSHSFKNSWLSYVFFRSRNFCYSQTQHKSLRISNFIHVQLPLLFKNLFHVFQSSSNMVWPFSVSFLRLSAVFDITRQSPTISFYYAVWSKQLVLTTQSSIFCFFIV